MMSNSNLKESIITSQQAQQQSVQTELDKIHNLLTTGNNFDVETAYQKLLSIKQARSRCHWSLGILNSTGWSCSDLDKMYGEFQKLRNQSQEAYLNDIAQPRQ